MAFARDSTALVMSVPAGPPSGGLYLNPPSSGGLWDEWVQAETGTRER
jgi:hypothetical protein